MKNFAYLAAVSVAFIAQAASAQSTKGYTGPLTAVTLRTATARASVTMDSVVWSFNGAPTMIEKGITIAGVPAGVPQLKVGMVCVVTPTATPANGTAVVKTLAC